MPVTMPVLPTVAIAGVPLLQVPGPEASNSGVVWPAHTAAVPVIGKGEAFTVTIAVAEQPLGGA